MDDEEKPVRWTHQFAVGNGPLYQRREDGTWYPLPPVWESGPKPWPVAEFLILMYAFLGFLILFGMAVVYR